jgi:hypothetical protein
MTKIVELVKPAPNARLIEGLREMLAQAESGEIEGVAGIKLRPDNGFAFYRIGDCSDLELAGALAFAQHDLISGNPKR